MKKQSTTIASIVILIIIAIFALLNTATVVVNLFGAQVKMPLVLLIFICLLIGAIIICCSYVIIKKINLPWKRMFEIGMEIEVKK